MLVWELRFQRDGFSVEAARKKGRPLPDDHWFHQKPTLPAGADIFLAAYRDLSTCRTPDGPIPWTSAMEWGDRRGLPSDLSAVLWGVIWRVDNAERKWRVDDLKREPGGA